MRWNPKVVLFAGGLMFTLSTFSAHADSLQDARLRADLQERMQNDARVQSYDVQIETNNAAVVLRGVVSSLTERDAAQEIALASPNIKSISNQIGVKPPVRSDRLIRNDAIAALRSRSDLNGSTIQVAARNQTVWISGQFPTLAMLDLAIQRVSEVRGVRLVDASRATIKSKVRFSDKAIRAAVAWALVHDGTVDAGKIEVGVRNGHVYLDGAAPTLFQIQQAETIARKITGARSVTSTLQLTPTEVSQPVG